VLVVVNILEFSCQLNFRSTRHGRGQDAVYQRSHPVTFHALSTPVPSLTHQPPSARYATSAATYTCSTASNKHLTQNLGQQTIPKRLLVCEGENPYNTAQFDWKAEGKTPTYEYNLAGMSSPKHLVSLFNLSHSHS